MGKEGLGRKGRGRAKERNVVLANMDGEGRGYKGGGFTKREGRALEKRVEGKEKRRVSERWNEGRGRNKRKSG